MDASWGIVIVSIVGTLGTVVGVILTNRHAFKLADAQRKSEAKAYRRDKLLLAFTTYLDTISQLDAFWEGTLGSGPEFLRDLRGSLMRKEVALAALSDGAVALAARAVTLAYAEAAPSIPRSNPELGGMRDRLTEAVREALLDA